jgi:hypothetical protein
LTAPVDESGGSTSFITEEITSDVSVVEPEIQVVDLYTVGYDPKQTVHPFVHQLDIDTGIGGKIRVWANFDDGALTNAMSITKFNSIKRRLGYYKPSPRWLRMADGNLIKLKAVWEGRMEIMGVQVSGSFKVFDSGGSWEFLLGKPMLTALQAIHEYSSDTVTIKDKRSSAVLRNQIDLMMKESNVANQKGTKEPEKREDLKGSKDTLPPREVHTDPCNSSEHTTDIVYVDAPETNDVTLATDKLGDPGENPTPSTVEIDVEALKNKNNVFTRFTEPRKKERVEEILRQVTIGPDLSNQERVRVLEFLTEWADVFALSVSEVKQVDNAIHHLDISPGTMFSTKVNQKPLTPPQRKYLYESIDTMLGAGIIEQCSPDQVKCVSPTTLAQKAHAGSGLMLEELQHRVNDECIASGFETFFDLPPRSSPTPDDESEKSEPKWRICQNFSQINKVTKIAPMPQGDIRAKQQ